MSEQVYRHIKSALILRGITVTSIAKKRGVTQPAITQTMQGRNKSRPNQEAIAEALGQPVWNVFPPDPKKEAKS